MAQEKLQIVRNILAAVDALIIDNQKTEEYCKKNNKQSAGNYNDFVEDLKKLRNYIIYKA